MVYLYAELVRTGRRTLEQVPKHLREAVREYLQSAEVLKDE